MTVGPVEGSTGPVLSVLVLAYERTEFLGGALRSILAQDPPPERIEILVVANVIDGAVRAEYEPKGIRFLISGHPELGAKVAEGARAATGEVICLLEDDDRFLPGKLSEVAQRFREDPDLAYYHNNFRTFGPPGTAAPGAFHKDGAARSIQRRGRVHRSAGSSPGGWGAFAGVFPGFNNSCISIRRRRFEPWWDYVARSDLVSDECLFLAAAATGGSILQDAAVLTELMVHPGSISNPGGGADLPRLQEFSRRNARSRRVLLELAERSGRPDVRRLAEAEVAIQDLVGCMRDPAMRRGDFARPLRVVLRHPRSLAVRNFPSVAVLGTLGALSPGGARSLYRWFKRRRTG